MAISGTGRRSGSVQNDGTGERLVGGLAGLGQHPGPLAYDGHVGLRLEPDDLALDGDPPNPRRQMLDHDVAARIAAHAVGAGRQQMKPGDAHPLVAIVRLVLVAPRLNRGHRIGGAGRRDGRGLGCGSCTIAGLAAGRD